MAKNAREKAPAMYVRHPPSACLVTVLFSYHIAITHARKAVQAFISLLEGLAAAIGIGRTVLARSSKWGVRSPFRVWDIFSLVFGGCGKAAEG